MCLSVCAYGAFDVFLPLTLPLGCIDVRNTELAGFHETPFWLPAATECVRTSITMGKTDAQRRQNA